MVRIRTLPLFKTNGLTNIITKENEMEFRYKGYRISSNGYGKRIYVSGPMIPCLRYWYNMCLCLEYIDFILKWIVPYFNTNGEKIKEMPKPAHS